MTVTAAKPTRRREARGPGHADHRRRRGVGAQGDPGDPGGGADRGRHPAVLRPPAARSRRRLPAVPGRGARRRQRPADPQAAGLLHARGRAGDEGQDPADLAGGRQGPAREHGVPADQPPAGLPDLRQGRRVPAAEPGAVPRVRRDPVHRRQAHLPQADQHLGQRAAGPGALRALRPLHPVLRAGRRRPVHRAGRAGRAAAGRDLREGAVLLLLLRQHHPDLPGGRADQRGVPVPLPALRPGLHPVGRRARRLRVGDPGRPPPRHRDAPAGRRRPRGQRGVDHRQGPVRLRLRARRGPAAAPAGPRRTSVLRPASWPEAIDVAVQGLQAAGRVDRCADRRPADAGGRVRVRQVRPRGAGHQQRRLPGPAALRRGGRLPGPLRGRHGTRGHLRRPGDRERGAAGGLRAGGGGRRGLPAAAQGAPEDGAWRPGRSRPS